MYTAQIITSLATTSHQSGEYALAFRVFVITVTVPGLLVSGTVPLLARAARDDRERLAYALQRIFEVSLILGIAAALGIYAGAPFIIKVVAGPKFTEFAGSIPVLRIMGVAMIASFLIAGWGFALLSLRSLQSAAARQRRRAARQLRTHPRARRHARRPRRALATLCGESTLAVGYLLVFARGYPELRPRLMSCPRCSSQPSRPPRSPSRSTCPRSS